MKVFHQLEEITPELQDSAVAIGNFDGVHLGHQALLARLVKSAKNDNLPPTVLTFYPHPVEVLRPQQKLERLTTTSEKLILLEQLGVEFAYVMRFDLSIAALSPSDFFQKYLQSGLKAKRIHVGFNFMFGKGRAGNISVLQSLCQKNAMTLEVEPAFESNGTRVSSSLIREAVIEGNVEKAKGCLGRAYFLTGTVRHGDGRGNQIGFPTANIHFSSEKVLPKSGVYVTQVEWQKQNYLSVTNVGTRPTFYTDAKTLEVETHILDFDSRIYDETLKVSFVKRLRDEMKFDSIENLKGQIARDIQTARAE